jgi:hypothetical protein
LADLAQDPVGLTVIGCRYSMVPMLVVILICVYIDFLAKMLSDLFKICQVLHSLKIEVKTQSAKQNRTKSHGRLVLLSKS